ncbi:unnamed protein product [Trypanosoma congolense IL3000]|uniref:WGS project CAEQ00000000 data, annotated contig 1917 n=1 Tax=Trypanosoma congolense (strain IL3000) TaxID=1068625 RepID=F9WA14_TRYCI|nr:unnamed protein product [Trypanosoma congolense IL3000]
MILAMKAWMVVMVVDTAGSVIGTHVALHKKHNAEEHHALCDLLGAAVDLWQIAQNGGSDSPPKKALGQAIFGNANGGTLTDLERGSPTDYEEHGDRSALCGSCLHGRRHYPGKSIPHELPCLCTVGQNGAPFNNGGYHSLCGVTGGDWGCTVAARPATYFGDGQHWDCTRQTAWNSGWDSGRRKVAW